MTQRPKPGGLAHGSRLIQARLPASFFARISDQELKALCLDALEAAELAYEALAGGLEEPLPTSKHP